TSAQSIDSDCGEGRGLATRPRSMRGMWFNEESALRSRHSIFKRWKQSHRRERSIALRQAQSREIRQDSVGRAVDFCWSCGRAAHSQTVELKRYLSKSIAAALSRDRKCV